MFQMDVEEIRWNLWHDRGVHQKALQHCFELCMKHFQALMHMYKHIWIADIYYQQETTKHFRKRLSTNLFLGFMHLAVRLQTEKKLFVIQKNFPQFQYDILRRLSELLKSQNSEPKKILIRPIDNTEMLDGRKA